MVGIFDRLHPLHMETEQQQVLARTPRLREKISLRSFLHHSEVCLQVMSAHLEKDIV